MSIQYDKCYEGCVACPASLPRNANALKKSPFAVLVKIGLLFFLVVLDSASDIMVPIDITCKLI